MDFEVLAVSVDEGVARVRLNRPDKANAMNEAMWQELRRAFEWIDANAAARVAILDGEGRHFTAGIDLAMLSRFRELARDACEGRKHEKLRRVILDLQACLSTIERCRKPVIAAIHGSCIGGGVDLACACDMRFASAEASFAIKEVDFAIAADVGTLQRMPKFVFPGIVAELAYTGRLFDAAEARQMGFANRVFASREELMAGVDSLARTIAAKSPLAVRGIKEMLVYARDHSVADGLNYVATWNAAMLMSSDLQEAMQAGAARRAPRFEAE